MEYSGLPARRLESPFLYLDFLENAGPRIMRLSLAGSQENLLGEVPTHWSTPFGEFYLRGGHRLWIAPERRPESSLPDNAGLSVTELPDGSTRLEFLEEPIHMRKIMQIQLDAHQPVVAIQHGLRNEGDQPVHCAPWPITILPLGGTVVLPFHPPAFDPQGLLPDRMLAFWPYSRPDDPRLKIMDEMILVEAQHRPTSVAKHPEKIKIGIRNEQGWLAYLNKGVLFIKRFTPSEHPGCTCPGSEHPGLYLRNGERLDLPHVDFGCNTEVYCDQYLVELETLGPLVQLQPGEETWHSEQWEIRSLPNAIHTPHEIYSLVAALL
jgi:hypothetical protein